MGVSISAFAASHELPGAAAPIIAASSLSGLLSSWYYGLGPRRLPAHRQLVIATAYLTGTALLLPFAPSALWLGAVVVITEAAVPPTLVLLNVLTERQSTRPPSPKPSPGTTPPAQPARRSQCPPPAALPTPGAGSAALA
ncbi:hypothetical protein [Kribbella catacumbae]|uniref:hypothetical protein n=1 Tax=Kribbella catacumbae TaxID=460086 RepID=UPI0003A6A6CA|nr:hypothetical protein [Kribbella catacumbae]